MKQRHLQAETHIHLWREPHEHQISSLHHNKPLVPLGTLCRECHSSQYLLGSALLSQEHANDYLPDLTQTGLVCPQQTRYQAL
jgi:hypothetical protein